MKGKTRIKFAVGVLVAVMLLALLMCGCSGGDDTHFSCRAYDGQGNVFHAFQSAQDGVWYVCVPSTQAVGEITLDFEGEITSASAGTLDAEGGKVTGAFTQSGDRLELKVGRKKTHTVVILQSDLPSVQISLKDTDLDTLHTDKDKKYKNNTFVLTDPEGKYDLTVEDSVEIKGRGNSTWTLADKKAYQIKFDEKTSLLGMGKAKKWILLANAFDDSMMRSQLVYTMAEKMGMPFVTSFGYVDLWIDGEYLGTYMLGEKVELGSSRLDLEQPSGALFEHDEGFYMEEDYWFYSEVMQRHFTMKEIVEEEDTYISAAMADFEAAVDRLAAYLYSTPSDELTLESLSTMIDVDSFAKYYLINEYALNRESFVSSFYWYMDGPDDVIHLGPIWDFDSCMGNDGNDYTKRFGDDHLLFKYLLASPEFNARTVELYRQYKGEFASMEANALVIKEQIKDSAKMNYLRWDLLGKPSNKAPEVSFHNTFDEAVAGVQAWLKGRQETFTVANTMAVTSQVSEDCRTMTLRMDDGGKYAKVQFAVWAAADEGRMTLWYDAQRIDGVWHSTVDLTHYNQSGIYIINTYADGIANVVAGGAGYVKTAVESAYELNIQLSAQGETMTVRMQDPDACGAVSFMVWSEENGKDDVHTFDAKRNQDGTWEYVVDMKLFTSKGAYYIHAYDGENGIQTLLDAAVVKAG